MYLVTTEQFEVDGELFYEGVSWKNYKKATKIENKNSIKYGRLYPFNIQNDIRNIVPAGWHIPSIEEWNELFDFVGGIEIAGKKLKQEGHTTWMPYYNIEGTNDYLFTSLPGGGWQGIFPLNYYSIYLISTSINSLTSYFVSISYYLDSIDIVTGNKESPSSIRLIKDNSINEGDIIIDGDTYNSITIGNQVWLQQNLAVKHYQNGDLINPNFSSTEGYVIAYNNDENNVYSIEEIEVESDDFVITFNGIDYIFPKDKVIETPRFTREQNIPFGEYQYRTHSDKHTEFFEPVKEYFGIDMKENYAAQFRDGINPHKDINGSIFKENPDQ